VVDRKGVEGAPQYGALAELAAGLSQQLQAQLVWMAQALAGHWPRLEKAFRRRLKELGYTAPQAASLEAITPGAAGTMLASGKSLADFLEQLRYRARRLAKLDLSPGQVLTALREYDRLLDEAAEKLFAGREADLRWARNQLHFLVVLTLNDAYYQVRDAESRTFYELFRAQTESGSLEQLWERCHLPLRPRSDMGGRGGDGGLEGPAADSSLGSAPPAGGASRSFHLGPRCRRGARARLAGAFCDRVVGADARRRAAARGAPVRLPQAV
jgi:hypothetical protein